MRYLLDTNGWIGFFEGRRDFGKDAKALLLDSSTSVHVSLASVWEASIKVGIGKLSLSYDLGSDLRRIFDENGIELIPVDFADVTGVQHLEAIHRDPFDRLQVVQARRRGLTVVSRDPVFERYGLDRIW